MAWRRFASDELTRFVRESLGETLRRGGYEVD